MGIGPLLDIVLYALLVIAKFRVSTVADLGWRKDGRLRDVRPLVWQWFWYWYLLAFCFGRDHSIYADQTNNLKEHKFV